MPNLKKLALNVSKYYHFESSLGYRYDQVFPSTFFVWHSLQELSISGLSTGVMVFFVLIDRRPRLRKISMCTLDFLDGTAEAGIEGLHRKRLTDFSLVGGFTCRGAPIQGRDYGDHVFIEAVEYYVLRGHRHPCLNATEVMIVRLGTFRSI